MCRLDWTFGPGFTRREAGCTCKPGDRPCKEGDSKKGTGCGYCTSFKKTVRSKDYGL